MPTPGQEAPDHDATPIRTTTVRLHRLHRRPAVSKAGGKVHREMRPLVSAAREQGWVTGFTTRGHLKLLPPHGGRAVIVSGTPSDHRSFKNTAAQLRRAGLKA